jgi:DNA helicase HerA-like ATPase
MEPPVKNKRPDYYYSVIHRLAKYKQNCDRIAYLQKDLGILGPKTTPGYTDMPHGSGTTDSTGDLAAKVSDKLNELLQLQKDVELIDYAVSMLSEIKQLIIDVKYKQENKDIYVQSILRKKHGVKSRDSYYRLKDEAVEELAKMMGEKKGE